MSKIHSLGWNGNRKPHYFSPVDETSDIEDEDLEKKYYSDDSEDASSLTASDFSSPSYTPILRESKHSLPLRRGANAYSHRSYRRFTRCFTFLLIVTLACFILVLTHQSWLSAKNVRLGLSKPAPPPPTWEKFPFLRRYHGGIRTLVTNVDNDREYPGSTFDNTTLLELAGSKKNSVRKSSKASKRSKVRPTIEFDPYYKYNSTEGESKRDRIEECFLDEANTIRVPLLRAFPGAPYGMPENVIGSYEVLGLRDDVCFDRFGKLGPYGLGYSKKIGGTGTALEGHREGIETIWKENSEVDYRKVRWADVQKRCQQANAYRFRPRSYERKQTFLDMDFNKKTEKTTSGSKNFGRRPDEEDVIDNSVTEGIKGVSSSKRLLPRIVVLIRTWWDYEYSAEDIMNLRAIISELSIKSGAEYSVRFLIHVKDDNMQIWADEETYQHVLDQSLPDEFKGMGTLWSERQMGLIYGGVSETFYRDLPVHGTYRSTFMPVQYFAHLHPEYDFVWHWEMDIRYTGNMYHLFDRASKWANAQPRKGLWERNSRFYVPNEHGSWEDFKQMVRVQTEHGTNTKSNMWSTMASKNPNVPDSIKSFVGGEKPIWGPEPPLDDDLDTTDDPEPPTSYSEDKYEWGVGEEADLITFSPMFDPQGTNWLLAEDYTGYNTTREPPPRRAAVNTASRLSRRLLDTMHRETAFKRHTMFTEMWPASCSLHHGLKAVYVPHPVFIDRKWPTDYLAAVFNGGRNGATGGTRASVFSDERQHNFLGVTWYYHAGFPLNLWKRWLGYKVDNDGGEEEEIHGEGRMCLPAMLLHPVKHVDMVS